MKVLGLFSGIGGFELGFQRAGHEIVGMCECDPYCQRVLRKHWPAVPIFDDVQRLTADGVFRTCGQIDIVTGGFPCQDISYAGRGRGLSGERSGLWYQMLRIIAETRPEWVVVENVAALWTRGLGDVLRGLDKYGYDAEWYRLSARSVGSPHRRWRLYLVAYPHGVYESSRVGLFQQVQKEIQRQDHRAVSEAWIHAASRAARNADGVPGRVDRIRALGNSILPQIAEIIGRAIMEATQ